MRRRVITDLLVSSDSPGNDGEDTDSADDSGVADAGSLWEDEGDIRPRLQTGGELTTAELLGRVRELEEEVSALREAAALAGGRAGCGHDGGGRVEPVGCGRTG